MPKGGQPRQQEAQAEHDSATVKHTQHLRDLSGSRQNIAIGPGGMRFNAAPYIQSRVQIPNQTAILSSPEKLIRADKRRNDVVYVWQKRDNYVTTAWMNSGKLIAVVMDDIDKANTSAFVQEVQMPAGPRPEDGMESRVVWGPLLLCMMPKDFHDSIYRAAEEEGWGAQARMNVSIVEQFESLGIKAELDEPNVTKETFNIQAPKSPVAAPA